ncbi:hypothetical protein HMPREF1572_01156 [Gardnerella vaginalis JCP7275]|nr:hypothetical protein HMPREF1572_01156 [Gardnerella vaginalis JCP7275]
MISTMIFRTSFPLGRKLRISPNCSFQHTRNVGFSGVSLMLIHGMLLC